MGCLDEMLNRKRRDQCPGAKFVHGESSVLHKLIKRGTGNAEHLAYRGDVKELRPDYQWILVLDFVVEIIVHSPSIILHYFEVN